MADLGVPSEIASHDPRRRELLFRSGGEEAAASPVACVVARGAPGASVVTRLHPVLADALTTLAVRPHGRAVVLVRLSPPTPVSAEIVHAVVDLLVEKGCDDVTVGSSIGSRDRDRGHSSVIELARRAGLLGRTARGRSYTLVDLHDELVPTQAPEASVLEGQRIARAWVEADTRVVVARAVTDLMDAYAAGLATLAGAVSEVPGVEPADLAVDLLMLAPPTLTVVDALAASVGADGGRILRTIDTETVVVASDVVSADCAVAALLGEDHGSSSLVEAAVKRLGPRPGRTIGDLTPWQGVTRPHPLARRAARRAAADPRLARVLSAAIGSTGPVDPVLAAVRSMVTPAVQAAHDAVGQGPLVGMLGAAALLTTAGESWATSFAKDRVTRRVVPLGFDPDDWAAGDYDGLPAFLAPLETVLETLPPAADPDRLRWTVVDDATVFEVSREIAADFDEFVARVDVAEGISLMADYLGGRRVVVGQPDDPVDAPIARTRQAERNLYLPQPNYLAGLGGEPIDVCKIELVERSTDVHRLLWRTVLSPNGSAVHDDGSLTFARTGTGTLATVRGRQLFTLPAPVEATGLTALPGVRGPLLEDAYRRFFTATFDNLEACFEGREYRIGRPPPDPDEPLLTEVLQLIGHAITQWTGMRSGNATSGETSAAGRSGAQLDAHGFTHVRGPR